MLAACLARVHASINNLLIPPKPRKRWVCLPSGDVQRVCMWLRCSTARCPNEEEPNITVRQLVTRKSCHRFSVEKKEKKTMTIILWNRQRWRNI